jgi:glycosyltransferase involved in cell wall biosynthesis
VRAGQKNKILIIVENLPVPFDRRVWQEATTLQRAGYEVSVICPKGKGHTSSYEELEGVAIYRHPLPPEGTDAVGYAIEYVSALFWQFCLTWRVFFTRGFDVIQACNPPDLIVLVAMGFKLFGKKFVFDHHDINPELYEVKFGRRDFFHTLLLAFERLTFRFADVSIATNESYKTIAVDRGGMPRDRVFVVRSGPDLSKFRALGERTADGLINVGYVGIMGDQDGVDALVRMARDIVIDRGCRGIRFTLIGEGTELENLRRLADEAGVSDHVTFTGYLRGDDLLRALSDIDIGVVPDAKNDYNDKCTMNKVMEYMAMGKPLVQYDLTEGRVSAGDCAIYAETNDERSFADAIVCLAQDPVLRARLGERGRRRVEEELDWCHEAPRLLDAYATVLGSS